MSRFNLLMAILACVSVSAGCAKKSSKRQPVNPSAKAAPVSEGKVTEAGTEENETEAGGEESRQPISGERPVRYEREEERVSDKPEQSQAEPIEEEVADSERPTETAPAPERATEPYHKDNPAPTTGSNEQCGTAYGHNAEMWAPGLPAPASTKRICTGGSMGQDDEGFRCEGNATPVYTDARQDGLMALAVDQFNRIPRHMDKGSRDLARRIYDLKVHVGRNGSVRAQATLLIKRGEFEKFEFRGARRRGDPNVRLIAVNAPRGLKFAAVLTCADADGGCSNSIFRLQQLTRLGKVGRVAYVVNRVGEAHVSITEQERASFRSLPNQAHAQFAEFLSNTVYNTCASVLRDALNGRRRLPSCMLQRLKGICGTRARFKQPAADDFQLRTWAVAYGRAGFEFEMLQGKSSRFITKGPLVAQSKLPMLDEPLQVSGAMGSSIREALMIANDGGGNINLQLSFAGEPQGQMRLNITSAIEDVRYSSQAVNARIRNLPALGDDEVGDEEDVRQNFVDGPVETPAEDSADESAEVAPRAVPAPAAAPVAAHAVVKKAAPAAKPPPAEAKPVPPAKVANVTKPSTPAAPTASAPKPAAAPAKPVTKPAATGAATRPLPALAKPKPKAPAATPTAPAEQAQNKPGAPQTSPASGV